MGSHEIVQQCPRPWLFVVVVMLLFYVHGKHLRSCRDGQLTQPHFSWIRPRGYKTSFMLNSVEHEILNAHYDKKNLEIRLS